MRKEKKGRKEGLKGNKWGHRRICNWGYSNLFLPLSFFPTSCQWAQTNLFDGLTEKYLVSSLSFVVLPPLLSGNFAFDFKVKSFDWKEHAYKYSIFYFEFFSSLVEVLGKTHYLLCCQCFQFVTYLSTYLNKFVKSSKL